MTKSRLKRIAIWTVCLAVLLVVAAGALRVVQSRRAQQQAAAVAATASKAQNIVELAATDIVEARTRDLAHGVPIAGSLKVVNSVVLKARIAGELQDLRVREGDTVTAGQVIARIEPIEVQARLKQAQEQADAARTQIDIAQRQYDNNKALVDQGFISRTALDTSQATLQSAQATHRAALAAVDMTKKSLDDTVLRSPISGQVAQRLAQPGERMAVDGKVVEIVDLRQMELEATLAAADSLDVRVGQGAMLQIEGSAGTGRGVSARVVRINPSTQPGSRSVLVYLAVDPAPGLRQGMFAQGTLDTGHGAALAVPVSAVRTDKPAPYVQVVEQQRIVHKPVQQGVRGQADREQMVAVTGVNAGDKVVKGSLGTILEGTAVRFTGDKAAGVGAASALPSAASSPKTSP